MKKPKKNTRDYHKVQKFEDGGAVEAEPTEKFGKDVGAWDYIKAGARDQLASIRRVARGDFTGDPMENTKAVYKTDKRK